MKYLQLHPSDSVAVALEDLAKGLSLTVAQHAIVLECAIPAGHKFCITPLASDQKVTKYGATIGITTQPIKQGEHIHTHNMHTALTGIDDYQYEPQQTPLTPLPETDTHFNGYRRSDGRVGTRNEIWVISSVGCVAKFAERIANLADNQYAGRTDGVVAFTHPFGCSQTGGDHDNTRRITQALAQHPNAGGILFVGLGCENNQIEKILEGIPAERHDRIRFFNCQNVKDEIQEGITKIAELVALCENDKRQKSPLSDLNVGMKCGGSDGFSGLTANVLVGRIAEHLCANKATVLLTETPEMFGAEHLLMNRACNKQVFDKTVNLINEFKNYFTEHGQNIYENPSPGNKEGGITTLEEKSMGAIQKGGACPVTDVLAYGEASQKSGLNLLQAPGNDAVSSTALAASGATLILFTTGRGTPLGFPAPTVKIASNSELATRKANWIDFDAYPVITREGIESVAQRFLKQLLAIASGEQLTQSEKNFSREIAIWKNGVTL